MESKEYCVLDPFFNSSRHWHFDELLEKSGISRSQLAQWLKKFEKQNLIKRIKPKGKMPYYVQNFDEPGFQNLKRLYGLKKINDSGLLNHLSALEMAKVVILFGSFSRYDWHSDSDIDIFIYGSDENFEQGKYELKVGREIQLFTAKSEKDLKKLNPGLLQNVLDGFIVKGSLEQLGVRLYA